MRIFFTLFCIAYLSLPELTAQIQTWPLDEIQPSPYQLMLPGDRFIPSTLRYNLIWADQIVPNWVTAAQLEFAAKNYIGTQKIWTNQIDLFRTYNSNFLGLIYHLAVGLNPEHNDDCKDPKYNSGSNYIGVVSPAGYVSEWTEHFLPWLADKGITLESDRFEDMFQHFDEFDKNHRVWHKDPYWLMNMENEDWQNYLNDQCIAWMQGNSDDGCFFDVSVEPYAYLYCPNIYGQDPYIFDWWKTPHKPYNSSINYASPNEFAVWCNSHFLKYYQNIYRNFHSDTADYLVIPNVDQMITTVYDPVWMDGDENGETIDGAMVEGFGNATGGDMYLSIERTIKHITGRGKILIAQFKANTPEERLRRTAMYMLVKNENSFININPQEVGWYPEYEIDLGDQKPCPKNIEDIKYLDIDNEKVFERRYSEGRVICNSSNETVSIKPLDWIPEVFGREYIIKTSGGGSVDANGSTIQDSIEFIDFYTEIDLPASECMITKFDVISTVEDYDVKNNDLILYPNPAKDFINIKTRSSITGNQIIKIFDMLGNSLKSFEYNSGFQIQQIEINDLSPGVYFLQMSFGGEMLIKKFKVVR